MKVAGKHYRTVWMEGSTVKAINQPLVPHKFEIADLKNFDAIGRWREQDDNGKLIDPAASATYTS